MKNKRLWQRVGAVLFALAVWQIAAMALDQSILLCSPVKVVVRLSELVTQPGFWSTLGFSAARIVGGFMIAFITGTLLAVLAGRVSAIEILLWPFVLSIKSIPVASFIIISLIWLTSRQLSIFISFLMVFPVIYTNVLQGIKSTDKRMLELAQVYKLPFRRRLLYIHMPAVKPFLLSACSVALGLSWKSGIAAEVIGIPAGSIGAMLYNAKIYFDTADLFAWTVVIVLVSQVFEKLCLRLIKLAFTQLEKL